MAVWSKPTNTNEEIIEFANQRVRILRRAFQRRLRVQVKADGEVLLTTGKTLPQRYLLEFLRDSWPWVIKTLEKTAKLRARYPALQYRQGEQILVLGITRQLQFHLSPTLASRIRLHDQALRIEIAPSLWPQFSPTEAHPEWREPVRRFYEREGRKLLAERLELFANMMNLRPKAITFRCQRTRWGSCSSQGRISLNWRLVGAPLGVLDYVVIHELAHLRFPNHSAQFWNLVQQYCPQFKEHNSWLRENHLALDFLL